MKLAMKSIIAVFCCVMFAGVSPTDVNVYLYSCKSLRIWGLDGFQCKSGNDVCTLKRYECDSVPDCPDMSDEDHCAREHTESCIKDFLNKKTLNGEPLTKFQCNDGMCILGCQRCDVNIDCLDGSDEMGCTDNEVKLPCN